MIIDLKDQTVGLRFLWSIPRSKLAQLPRWDPLRDEVPLTPHKAATVATDFVRSGFPSVTQLSGFLGKKSNRCVLLDRDRSLIGRDITEEERKQGRFASAIGAHQSDPIAAIDLERHVVEERPAGERL